MKERFIQRYKDAVLDYFNWDADKDGRMIRHFIVREYEKILTEEFGVEHDIIDSMYQELYKATYVKDGKWNGT